MNKFYQILIGLLLLLVITIPYPKVAFEVLFLVSEAFRVNETGISLVGEANEVDPGALIVVLFYVGIFFFISGYFAKKELAAAAKTLRIGSLIMSIYVFAITSSLLWF